MMKFLNPLISLVLVLVFSCKDKKEVIINESDLLPTTKKDSIIVEKVKINFRDTLRQEFLYVTDSIGMLSDSLTRVIKKPFLARFGAQGNYSFVTHFEGDSLQFEHYAYIDSVKTKSAFFNYLDKFGDKEVPIQIGQELSVSKQYFLVLVSNQLIYSFQSSKKLNLNFILAKYEKIDWKFVVEQIKGSKTKWFSTRKKVKTTIKPIKDEGITIIE